MLCHDRSPTSILYCHSEIKLNEYIFPYCIVIGNFVFTETLDLNRFQILFGYHSIEIHHHPIVENNQYTII